MPLEDTKGVKWAHSDTVKEGDRLICDGGFTCLHEHSTSVVKADHTKIGIEALYIECADGQHFLDGQIGDDGELVGLYPVH